MKTYIYKTIFSGCGHEVDEVIADMRCPVCMTVEIEAKDQRIAEQQKTIAFFASVIKSGERWSEQCQAALEASEDTRKGAGDD